MRLGDVRTDRNNKKRPTSGRMPLLRYAYSAKEVFIFFIAAVSI
jgi:hypothetical protein